MGRDTGVRGSGQRIHRDRDPSWQGRRATVGWEERAESGGKTRPRSKNSVRLPGLFPFDAFEVSGFSKVGTSVPRGERASRVPLDQGKTRCASQCVTALFSNSFWQETSEEPNSGAGGSREGVFPLWKGKVPKKDTGAPKRKTGAPEREGFSPAPPGVWTRPRTPGKPGPRRSSAGCAAPLRLWGGRSAARILRTPQPPAG